MYFRILGVLAMSFDTLFMVQHYILYRHSNSANLGGKHTPQDSNSAEEQQEPDERSPLV